MTQRGFSLVEALIALLILSLGLVGVAAMQLKALQSATQGYQRSVASIASVDAQERMWGQLARDDVDGCADIDIEAEWKAQWFADSDSNPLRNANAQESNVIPNGCEFTIEIDLGSRAGDAGSDIFTYTLRLPDIEGEK
ncbi:type IV pilus modification protein PilV [Halomonas sp. hl-4]|uniref:type IV pilus modification protein PilV n=1 Tax=Halomonas sp. hl-4 TaxID=1761789 RepID=UPI000BB6F96D|nr:type IV pilus modification protein PilV [Halomonas sp. hl-4]SNY98620.1 type IV pilus assembly protein PilV [Halomonas sp. hl-4]